MRIASAVLLALFLLPLTSSAEPVAPGPVGIAPLEADLLSMRRTLAELEAAVVEGRPERAADLVVPDLPDPAREAVLAAVEARVQSLPQGAHFTLRSDIGEGAVVPIGPERVQVQVRSTTTVDGQEEAGAVYLELQAVESVGRRRWLLRSVRFSGVSSGPSAGSLAGIVLGGCLTGAVLVAVVLLVARWCRKKR